MYVIKRCNDCAGLAMLFPLKISFQQRNYLSIMLRAYVEEDDLSFGRKTKWKKTLQTFVLEAGDPTY